MYSRFTFIQTQLLQYWAAEGKAVYGNITVKTMKFTTDTDFIIRQFEVVKVHVSPIVSVLFSHVLVYFLYYFLF